MQARSRTDRQAPALSLVNLIDAGELMRNGQRNAWVMFNFTVESGGRP